MYKSELLKEIESDLAVEEVDIVPGSSAVIIYFIVLVRMVCIDTSKCKTFGELSETLLSIIFGMYTVASRIDVVCDRYDVSDSIKAAERARRGTVDMQQIAIHNENTPLPKQRIKMLSNSRNKANIVDFLYRHWIDKGREKLTASQKLILAGGFKDGREAMILTKQSLHSRQNFIQTTKRLIRECLFMWNMPNKLTVPQELSYGVLTQMLL